ncbi:MAG: class I adenylate-forming enzyme family protein [Acidimicrobiia bacterium]
MQTANIATNLAEGAARDPLRTALFFADTTWSYREVDDLTTRLASGLRSLQMGTGDRIAVMLPNLPEFHFATHATWKAGGVEVPINTMYKEEITEHILRDAGVKVAFATAETGAVIERVRGRLPDFETLVAVGPGDNQGTLSFDELLDRGSRDFTIGNTTEDDLAVIAYTSGTTGFPKGAMLTHRQVIVSMEALRRSLDMDESDNVLQVLPCFHSNASLIGIVFAWFLGSTAVLVERFETEAFVSTVRETRPTFFAFVPTLLHDLSRAADQTGTDFSSVRYVVYGAAPCPPRVRAEVEQRFDLRLLQAYGMTEAPNAVTLDPVEGQMKPESVGRPLPHIRVTVVNDDGDPCHVGKPGEICLGPAADGESDLVYEPMKGYWQNPEDTVQALRDGLFHTGDIGRVDGDGFVYVIDRKKDMIIRGGNNVFPAELERVLVDHPSVEEAYVVGVPDDRLGEVPKAYVVPRAGAQLSAAEIIAHVGAHLATYKRLEFVEFVTGEALPRNALGKVLKRELRVRPGANG